MVLLYLDKCTCTNKEKKMEEVKEEFYNLLEQNINRMANSDIKIIFGDFNAEVATKTYTNPPLAVKVYIMKPKTME